MSSPFRPRRLATNLTVRGSHTRMIGRDEQQLQDLLDLAHARDERSRRVLLENISDLCLSPEGRLSDHERALMTDIVGKLLHDVEMRVRRELANRLLESGDAPHELVVQLANDDIEVARPLLINSQMLTDPDLIEIVKHRGEEHQLAIAVRSPLNETVSQALIDLGSDNVIETLVDNHDAQLSLSALEYLVEESQRVDRFQQPLLKRDDLPADLAVRMYWWVSAALRRHILDNYPLDPTKLDEAIETSTNAVIAESNGDVERSEAEKLVDALALRGELTETFLLQSLRASNVSAFIAGLARRGGVDLRTAQRIVFDPGGETLAVACRAVDISRSGFATIFMLCQHSQSKVKVRTPGQIESMLRYYDQIKPDQAQLALRYWARDTRYRRKIDALGRQDG